MYRKDVQHPGRLFVADTTSQMNRVLSEFARDECMALFDPDIVKFEEWQHCANERGTHFNGRMARLRINSAGMRDTHHQIEIAHDLRE